MAENVLYGQDFDPFFVQHCRAGVTQSMRGHLKLFIYARGRDKLFKIIFNGPDGYPVAFFRYKKRVVIFCVIDILPDGKIILPYGFNLIG